MNEFQIKSDKWISIPSKNTIKLNLFKVQQEKQKAAQNQRWERAAALRDHEKELSNTYHELKVEVMNALEGFDLLSGDVKDYFFLHELLFEFSPFDFLHDSVNRQNWKTIDDYTGIYLQTQREMSEKLLSFLDEEYAIIRKQVRESGKESDVNRTLSALEKLKTMAESLQQNRLDGHRRKILLLTGYMVLFYAPFLDEVMDKVQDRNTYYSTLFYLLLILILSISYFISRKFVKINDTDYNNHFYKQVDSAWFYPYRFTQFVFLSGLLWQASYNLLVLIRKTMVLVNGSSGFSSHFYELFTN